MGAGSEAREIYNALPAARAYADNDILYFVLTGILFSYPTGFYTMYMVWDIFLRKRVAMNHNSLRPMTMFSI